MFDYDAEIRRYNELFRDSTGIGAEDRVLDIGCGAGQSTRDAARTAVAGSALGVDISEQMLELARRRSADEGIANVTFQQADAQRHPFPTNHFDIAISRFGTMFFPDPLAAFSNIGRALRPAGRLVMLVWQADNRQEWTAAIREAVPTVPAQPAADPFSLADPSTVRNLLTAAGFATASLTDLHEPIYYGPDAATAAEAVLTLRMTQDPLATLTADNRQRALDRLHATLLAHETDHGVWFDSRAWLISTHRR